MKRYESYKDSGIGWIEEIPEHWEVKQIKHLLSAGKEGIKIGPFGSTLKLEFIKPFGIKIYGQENVIKDNFSLGYKFIDRKKFQELLNYQIFSGDIVVTMMGTTGKAKVVPNNIQIGIMDSHLTRIRVNTSLFLPRLLELLINYSYCIASQIKFQSKGAIMDGLNSSIIKSLYIPLPPLLEQTQISKYLDQKTTQIDKLINDKQKLIALLNEERTAMINQAVTKGLDPNVPMKDSGVEWLGEIPAHWEVKRMKYLCEIGTGGKDTENREDGGAYPFYVRSQTVERISSYSFDGEAILTAGDGVGVCKVWHYVNEKFDYHQRVYRMSHFKDIKGKFLYLYLKENFEKEVMKLSAKSTVDSLRRPMFQNFSVAYPSEWEQNKIIEHLDAEKFRIKNLLGTILQEIDLLKEYKMALISEVVTGKVDVRGEVLN